jgi:hypothetical protein
MLDGLILDLDVYFTSRLPRLRKRPARFRAVSWSDDRFLSRIEPPPLDAASRHSGQVAFHLPDQFHQWRVRTGGLHCCGTDPSSLFLLRDRL